MRKREREREREREMGVFSATDGRAGLASRPPREDHDLPRSLDDLFSNWKVLVGPNDWRNYYVGQEGAEKYRLYNLPSTDCFHSGVYELALYLDKSIHAHGTRKGTSRSLKKDALVPVYVGQTENARERLQDYGRNGSHLEGLIQDGKCQQCETSFLTVSQTKLGFLERIVVPTNQELCPFPHLFTSAFDRGYFIAFRWAAKQNKGEAAALEAQLLQCFDYAWNRGSNGKRRPEDALRKLQLTSRAKSWYTFNKWINTLHKAGPRKIPNGCDNTATNFVMKSFSPATKGSVPVEKSRRIFELLPMYWRKKATEEKTSSFSQLICRKKQDGHGRIKSIVCGIMDDSGDICSSIPPLGRKRCESHKGMRRHLRPAAGSHILTSNSLVGGPSEISMSRVIDGKDMADKPPLTGSGEKELTYGINEGTMPLVCGYISKDGLECLALPAKGRKRCAFHKGRRAKIHDSGVRIYGINEDSLAPVCGYISKDGLKCMALPVKGRKRCESHKGRHIKMQFADRG